MTASASLSSFPGSKVHGMELHAPGHLSIVICVLGVDCSMCEMVENKY